MTEQSPRQTDISTTIDWNEVSLSDFTQCNSWPGHNVYYSHWAVHFEPKFQQLNYYIVVNDNFIVAIR